MAKTNPMLVPVELPDQGRSTAGEVMASGEDPELSEISSVRVLTEGAVHIASESGERRIVNPVAHASETSSHSRLLIIGGAVAVLIGIAAWVLS